MSDPKHDFIFSLDIGTRSVVGLIVKLDGDTITIIDREIMEHKERSMMDGQIHDVVEVSRVIESVKNRLSERNGPLKDVAVAAAGRSLRTKRVQFEEWIGDGPTLTRDDVLAMELAAVQEAQRQLAKEQDGGDLSHYYCVGYSAVNYYLDDEIIGNLIHQRGSKAKVDVIATFLPRVVVDSLMTALQQAQLQMRTLTLEPIAAIHVLIPSTMRKLNIALVDVGAGTSDVAITAEGTVTAYGMVPFAGDEITDALCEAYILDFPDAEEIKRKLSVKETVSFTDILGLDYSLTTEEMILSIEKEIDKLAQGISEKILELNGKAPQAVMLIGGGSLTPLLPEKLAARLGLPPSRVAVRSTDAIKNLAESEGLLEGPEFVTPIGIAVAADQHPVKYLSVKVNGENVRIFDLKQLTIGDILLHFGFDIKRLHGKPGLAMSLTINEKVRFIPGTYGSPAKIRLNAEEAHLDTPIKDQDEIFIEVGKDGTPPDISLHELIEELGALDLYLNNQLYSISPSICLNGQEGAAMKTKLKDRDVISFTYPKTILEVLGNVDHPAWKQETILYTVNGIEQAFDCWEYQCQINQQPASLYSPVKQGDRIQIQWEQRELPLVSSVISIEPRHLEVQVSFNGKPLRLPVIESQITVNGNPLLPERRLQHQDQISLVECPLSAPIFSDVFRFIDMADIPKPDDASHLVIKVNQMQATYQTEIKHGDSLELYWE